jgi:hypothetical protein
VRTVRRIQGGVRQGRHRENIWVYERERGISEWLVRKVEERYVRTNSKVKVERKRVNGLRRQRE